MLNILIAGVGGQGTLLASRVLGKYALDSGFDCKLSEVHGMAQRGGSVITYVRISQNADEKIYSPIIDEGGADIVLAFEKLEALRYMPYLKKDGIVLYSSQEILPMPVVTGEREYPRGIESELGRHGGKRARSRRAGGPTRKRPTPLCWGLFVKSWGWIRKSFPLRFCRVYRKRRLSSIKRPLNLATTQ